MDLRLLPGPGASSQSAQPAQPAQPSSPASQPTSRPAQPPSEPASRPARNKGFGWGNMLDVRLLRVPEHPASQPSQPINPASQPASQPASPASQPSSQPAQLASHPASQPTRNKGFYMGSRLDLRLPPGPAQPSGILLWSPGPPSSFQSCPSGAFEFSMLGSPAADPFNFDSAGWLTGWLGWLGWLG